MIVSLANAQIDFFLCPILQFLFFFFFFFKISDRFSNYSFLFFFFP